MQPKQGELGEPVLIGRCAPVFERQPASGCPRTFHLGENTTLRISEAVITGLEELIPGMLQNRVFKHLQFSGVECKHF